MSEQNPEPKSQETPPDGLTDEEFKRLIRESGTPAEKFMIHRIVRQRKQITALTADRDEWKTKANRYEAGLRQIMNLPYSYSTALIAERALEQETPR